MANKSIYMAPLTPYLMKPFKITILQQSLTCISLIRSCSWHLRTTLRDLQCALMPMRRLSSNINWWKTVLTIKQYQMVLFAPVVIILALIAMQHPILKHQTLPTLPTLRTPNTTTGSSASASTPFPMAAIIGIAVGVVGISVSIQLLWFWLFQLV